MVSRQEKEEEESVQEVTLLRGVEVEEGKGFFVCFFVCLFCFLRHETRINSSFSHTQPVHQASSESVHNVLKYREICFWLNLSMMKNRF